ncbi:hypothetical protein PFLUV_G00238360 [Perca fluviatilis]|uniref:SRCR domain-containing protein n=1 Tax=Perca fluviatilis TaxID=8168 RepID=A0A6A5DRH7_PERFL|nr:hypothetical protein PFLUV_G00238360 [Perca fluviatilis]
MWTKVFQCGGHESALLDCRSSISDRNTCSPGKAVGLTCSEPVRLVGGSSHCDGTLEVKQGKWRPMVVYPWTLMTAAAACRELDCGSAVSVEERKESPDRSVWRLTSNCVQSGSALRECAESRYSAYIQDLTCLDLLLQPNISVSSIYGVSEAQQQGFQVFRGSTFNISCSIQPQYPGGSFQLTFTSSNSTHNSTQPAVNHSAHFLFPAAEPAHQGTYSCVYHLYVFSHNFSSASRLLSLTVSDLLLQPNSSVSSSMDGVSEAQQQVFQVFRGSTFNISCSIQPQYPGGSFQLTFTSSNSTHNFTQPAVNHSAHFLFPAAEPAHQGTYSCVYHLYVFCHNFSSESCLLSLTVSGSVRLVGGASRCTGTLEVKHEEEWRPVDLYPWTLKTAAAACRELDCGSAVSVEETKESSDRSVWWIRSDCVESGSALRECAESSSSSSILHLSCLEPEAVKLVGGASRCAGTLEVKHHKEWKPVSYNDSNWPLKTAAAACRDLDCGSAVSAGQRKESSHRSVWRIRSDCVESGSALRECATSDYSSSILYLSCSDLLLQPNISVSSMDRVSEAQQQGFQVFRGSNFTISCSIQPQYPGGSFQLTFTSSNSAHNSTQPAVNHSAHFLFPAAEPAHQGNYSCVYHLYVFSHNFSSESCLLSLTVSDASDPPDPSTRRPFIIRVVVFSLTLLLVITALSFYCKASRGLQQDRQNIELLYYKRLVATAEGWLTEEEGAE